MEKIGFVGLGMMGAPMALKLVKNSKNTILCYDIDKNRVSQLEKEGAISAHSIYEVAHDCNIIFLSMPSNEILKDNVMKILETGHAGMIIVDMGSTAPKVIYGLYEMAKAQDIYLMDCPVSGGPAAAEKGSLAIMCGGEEQAYMAVLPYLRCMGKSITYTGPSGSGSATKLVNNIIVGGILLSVAEAFAFGAKAGLDATTLFNAIKDGGAKNAFMENNMFRRMVERDYVPGARAAVHQKDLKNAVDLAKSLDIDLPLTKLILSYMAKLEQQGRVNEDHCAIATIYEDEMNVHIG